VKRSWHLILQGLALGVQAGNQYGQFVPDKYKPSVALGVGIGQLILGFIAHNYNPDGTRAEVAYIKK
jgi:hypothetical protein